MSTTVEKIANELEKELEEYMRKIFSDRFGVGNPSEYLKHALNYCIKVSTKLAKSEDEFWKHFNLCVQDVISAYAKILDTVMREMRTSIKKRIEETSK